MIDKDYNETYSRRFILKSACEIVKKGSPLVFLKLVGCDSKTDEKKSKIHQADFHNILAPGKFRTLSRNIFKTASLEKNNKIKKLIASYWKLSGNDYKNRKLDNSFYEAILKEATKNKTGKDGVKATLKKLLEGALIYKSGKLYKPKLRDIIEYCSPYYTELPFDRNTFLQDATDFAKTHNNLSFIKIKEITNKVKNGDIYYDPQERKLIELKSPQSLNEINQNHSKTLRHLKLMGYKVLDQHFVAPQKPLIILVGNKHFQLNSEPQKASFQRGFVNKLTKHSLSTAYGEEGSISPYAQKKEIELSTIYPPFKPSISFTPINNHTARFSGNLDLITEVLNNMLSSNNPQHLKANNSQQNNSFTKIYGLESQDFSKILNSFGFIEYSFFYQKELESSINILSKPIGNTVANLKLRSVFIEAEKYYRTVRHEKLNQLFERFKAGKYGKDAQKVISNITLQEFTKEMFIKNKHGSLVKFKNKITEELRSENHAKNFITCLIKDKHKNGLLESGALHLTDTIKQIKKLGFNYIVIDNPLIDTDNKSLIK